MEDHIDSECKLWDPQRLLNGGFPMVLVILNQPLAEATKLFVRKNWDAAVLRVAVDGGINKLQNMSDNQQSFVPDIICGDFDSVTTDVLDHYSKLGSEVVNTPDQDETDFTKALRLTNKYLTDKNLKAGAIVAIAKNGERLDHLLGNLNTLFLALEITPIPIFILGDSSLTWLLQKGKHRIVVSKEMLDSHVGLIPLGEPCLNATTTGLQWNLSNTEMKFGELISTSNKFDGSDCVTVDTKQKLLWTMEFNFS